MTKLDERLSLLEEAKLEKEIDSSRELFVGIPSLLERLILTFKL
ncbi:hypothetical protein JCM19240_1794 [Vibrio maritimus]|uniref:Uncharacterized protein n=1 Tax=Vibrio maritimus TaxID=990268 RepID=A0A090T8P9_9VIBR|nr:hypothetical protein JCM19240_1794 [Vibrio maritimus]